MRPRKGSEPHPNHERWLVSYADFITLMFAFFVVMFASARADRGRAARVSESVRRALESGRLSAVLASVLGGGPTADGRNAPLPAGSPKEKPETNVPADLMSSLVVLREGLAEDIRTGKVQLRLDARGLIISLREAAFFPSGEDAIVPDRFASIGKIADVIRSLPNAVRLEGHTDPVPIHNARFHNNWELSTARSIAMLQLFSTRFGLPAGRLSVAGYADTAPVSSNDSAEGRARNRRVDVVVLSVIGQQAEPSVPSVPQPGEAGETRGPP